MTTKDEIFLKEAGFKKENTEYVAYIYSRLPAVNFLQNNRLINIFNATYTEEIIQQIEYAYLKVSSSGTDPYINYDAEVYVKLTNNTKAEFLMSSEDLLETIEQALVLSYHQLK